MLLTGNRAQDDRRLAEFLQRFTAAKLPASELAAIPASLTASTTLSETAAAIRSLEGTSPWIDRCIGAMKSGCATSIGVVHEQIRRCKSLSLADAFRMEMVIATHCALNMEFAEGVRALLIDKDNAPKWTYPSLDALPASHVQSHFAAPWPKNPLADLGA